MRDDTGSTQQPHEMLLKLSHCTTKTEIQGLQQELTTNVTNKMSESMQYD